MDICIDKLINRRAQTYSLYSYFSVEVPGEGEKKGFLTSDAGIIGYPHGKK